MKPQTPPEKHIGCLTQADVEVSVSEEFFRYVKLSVW